MQILGAIFRFFASKYIGRKNFSIFKGGTSMETVLNMIINAENIRFVLMVALGWSGFVLLKSQMKEMGYSLNKRIDELKYNDIAHLNSSIEALTYALEKNGALKREDKEFVDSRLAR